MAVVAGIIRIRPSAAVAAAVIAHQEQKTI